MEGFINFLKKLKYNHFLAAAIFCSATYMFLQMGTFAEAKDGEILRAALIFSAGGIALFGFMGKFTSIFGALFKSLCYVAIGSTVLYLWTDIEQEMILLILRIGMGIFMSFGVGGFIVFLFFTLRREKLIKHGWKLETKLVDIVSRRTGKYNQYYIHTRCPHPDNGNTLNFESNGLRNNPKDSLNDDDVFKVYVDKVNPEKYYFDLNDFRDDRLFA